MLRGEQVRQHSYIIWVGKVTVVQLVLGIIMGNLFGMQWMIGVWIGEVGTSGNLGAREAYGIASTPNRDDRYSHPSKLLKGLSRVRD